MPTRCAPRSGLSPRGRGARLEVGERGWKSRLCALRRLRLEGYLYLHDLLAGFEGDHVAGD